MKPLLTAVFDTAVMTKLTAVYESQYLIPRFIKPRLTGVFDTTVMVKFTAVYETATNQVI
jgi:hypothetical protein